MISHRRERHPSHGKVSEWHDWTQVESFPECCSKQGSLCSGLSLGWSWARQTCHWCFRHHRIGLTIGHSGCSQQCLLRRSGRARGYSRLQQLRKGWMGGIHCRRFVHCTHSPWSRAPDVGLQLFRSLTCLKTVQRFSRAILPSVRTRVVPDSQTQCFPDWSRSRHTSSRGLAHAWPWLHCSERAWSLKLAFLYFDVAL